MEEWEISEIEKQEIKNKELKIAIIILAIIIFIIAFVIPITSFILRPAAKPIIYLYPEEEISVEVKFKIPEKLTCTYPKYENSWNVTAKPNGDLIDNKTKRSLYALYWEGIGNFKCDKKEGFVVKKEDTINFLEEKLKVLGLNEREANEFIIYWLPKLEENPYNYIRFATTEEINKDMPVEITPKPDVFIRVLMQYQGLKKPIEVKEQILETPERKGYVAVEWGGTELKN